MDGLQYASKVMKNEELMEKYLHVLYKYVNVLPVNPSFEHILHTLLTYMILIVFTI